MILLAPVIYRTSPATRIVAVVFTEIFPMLPKPLSL